MKPVLSIILVIIFFTNDLFAQPQTNEITTVILVRHAEKQDNSQNPDLSTQGYNRADLLARMMSKIEFNAVYSTSFIRTVETVRSVADQNQLEIMVYDSKKPETVTANWLDTHRGEFILVSGHSNTVPQFANALLGREHFTKKFDESDYGNILIITIPAGGERHLIHLKY